jgi:YVTN family beta-propeller protein
MVTRRYARRRAATLIGAGVLAAAGLVVWAVVAGTDPSPKKAAVSPSGTSLTGATSGASTGRTSGDTTGAAGGSSGSATGGSQVVVPASAATPATSVGTPPGPRQTDQTVPGPTAPVAVTSAGSGASVGDTAQTATGVTSLTIPVVPASGVTVPAPRTSTGQTGAPSGTDATAGTGTAGTFPDGTGPDGTGPDGTAPPETFPAPKDVPALADDGKTSAQRTMSEAFVIKGDDSLSPKSVVTDGKGLFFVQNEDVGHDVTVYDRTGAQVGQVSDRVDLSRFAINGGVVEGAPTEAAFSRDGTHLYVTNYQMTGPGYDPAATDDCNEGQWDDSFVYRIDVATLQIDQVIPVGSVPEFIAVTPDGKRLITSNWCGFDLSIVDIATGKELSRVPIGRHPRGLAITADSRTAYVAVMGAHQIAVVDLTTMKETDRFAGGVTPRHLALSGDGSILYVSNNRDYVVRAFNTSTRKEVGRVVTGKEPRTIALSPDGTVLYVVNYEDDLLTKVSTKDMKVLQQIPTGKNPIGVTYDPATRQVWVANRSGSLSVFVDR